VGTSTATECRSRASCWTIPKTRPRRTASRCRRTTSRPCAFRSSGGRSFTAADVGKSPPVVLINETFAQLGWAGADPIGQKVQYGGPDRPWHTVVGIVGNVHHTGLDEERAPQLYIPNRRDSLPTARWTWRSVPAESRPRWPRRSAPPSGRWTLRSRSCGLPRWMKSWPVPPGSVASLS
jgi:hypothetical protein